jgi:hypothetical protein
MSHTMTTERALEILRCWCATSPHNSELCAATEYVAKRLSQPAAAAPDGFNGDNAHLIECAKALIELDAKGALIPHGIGGHARQLLQAFIARLPIQALASKAVEWPAIKSAPKDGSSVVLCNEHGITATCYWMEARSYNKDGGLWVSWPYIHGEPTNWTHRPSPEPPQAHRAMLAATPSTPA